MPEKKSSARNYILRQLEDGTLKAGEKLSGAREIARLTGRPLPAVQSEIELLAQEGVLETVPRRGTFVSLKWDSRILRRNLKKACSRNSSYKGPQNKRCFMWYERKDPCSGVSYAINYLHVSGILDLPDCRRDTVLHAERPFIEVDWGNGIALYSIWLAALFIRICSAPNISGTSVRIAVPPIATSSFVNLPTSGFAVIPEKPSEPPHFIPTTRRDSGTLTLLSSFIADAISLMSFFASSSSSS